jgi:hypothetical protein
MGFMERKLAKRQCYGKETKGKERKGKAWDIKISFHHDETNEML